MDTAQLDAFNKRFADMELLLTQLNNENIALKEEIKTLKAATTSEAADTNERQEFSTDEEELQRETDWIVKQSRRRQTKKRKQDQSPRLDNSLSENSGVKATQNNENNGSGSASASANKVKENLPPPINVIGITEFAEVRTMMKAVTDKSYSITSLNNDVWKLNTTDSDSYRNLTKKLNEEKIQWYTYEDKHNRPIKIMVRGLHPTCSSEEIKLDLEENGFNIINAVNIIKKEKIIDKHGNTTINKRGLPLFMLTFDNKENIKKVYDIKAILNMKVKIEPLKKNNYLIAQCKKCQGYNHTQKYCGREARCVKCAGKHITGNCPLNINIPARCVNCKGQHPANYRGCEIARELQKIRDKTRKPEQPKTPVLKIKQIQEQNKPGNSSNKDGAAGQNKLYSEALKQKEQTKDKMINTTLETILAQLESINKRLDRQEETSKSKEEALQSKLENINQKILKQDDYVEQIASTLNNMIAHYNGKKK